jgi:hypothetical protein
MGRLYLNERLLKQIGLDEATVTTLRKLTEFIEAQEAIAAAEAEIEANGTAIDAANTDITAANAAINALDVRIDAYDALAPFVRENQAARPAYTPYAGQNFSAAYVEAEAQATDDAVLALSTAFNALLTRLDTVNLLT